VDIGLPFFIMTVNSLGLLKTLKGNGTEGCLFVMARSPQATVVISE